MKKIFLSIVAIVAAFSLGGCDSKVCYCYESTSTGTIEQQVYVHSDTPCNSMSKSNRGCIESNERGTFDPNQIAK